ncbi:MAG: glycerol-3-phosphate dehydrogenase, partial [Pseudomonadota bacterium]
TSRVRLVRGSHIVVRKLFDHGQPYIFQHSDGRIVFAIPYETDFTLIGTTDVDHDGDPGTAACSDEEARYLCGLVSEYFEDPVTTDDIVWTYSGVRPLFDDGTSAAAKVTRDYMLQLDEDHGAPLLNVFGGKITTYRKLSEEVLEKLRPAFPDLPLGWTGGAHLPGGDFAVDGVDDLVNRLRMQCPEIDGRTALRLIRAYGTEAAELAQRPAGLGRSFGAGLTEAEVDWLMTREWAETTDDILWRRSKLGLRLNEQQVSDLSDWMAEHGGSNRTAAA